jgi:nucleoside-diphosphate-sugar epimerase
LSDAHFPEQMRGVEWYQGDFTDATALASAVQSFDVIFHLANGTNPQSANLDVQKNLLPTLALLELVSKLRVVRIIFASARRRKILGAL